jgi:hypothetical protein
MAKTATAKTKSNRKKTESAAKSKAKKNSMASKAKNRAKRNQTGGGLVTPPTGISKFQPKKGTFNLDILPYVVSVKNHPEVSKGELWYQRTYWAHFGLGSDGKMAVICPKTINKPCPICEYVKSLFDSEEEESIEMAKRIKAKARELYNVIDLDDQDKGVQIFDYSYHLFGKALEEEINEGPEEWAGFADLEGGYTLETRFRKGSMGGSSSFFEVAKINFEERDDYDEEILEQVHDLDKLIQVKSYDELKAALFGTDEEEEEEEVTTEEEDDEDEDEEEEEEKPKKGKSSSKKSSKDKKQNKKDEEEDEDEDEDEDEEEDEEEEDEKPKKKSSSGKRKPTKPSSKKSGKGKGKKNKCPGGGEFGVDTGELDECDDCDLWPECEDANEEE